MEEKGILLGEAGASLGGSRERRRPGRRSYRKKTPVDGKIISDGAEGDRVNPSSDDVQTENQRIPFYVLIGVVCKEASQINLRLVSFRAVFVGSYSQQLVSRLDL